MHGMGSGEHREVVPPVIGGRPKAMDQQQRRRIGKVLLGLLMHRVDGVSEVAPAVGIHDEGQQGAMLGTLPEA